MLGLCVSPTVTLPEIVQCGTVTWGQAGAMGGVYVIYVWDVTQIGVLLIVTI